MKRMMMALVLIFAMALPATAAETVCGRIFGFASLQAGGNQTATGQALVFFNGGAEVVPFESYIVGADVEQDWHFSAGLVEITEHPNPVFLPGPYQTINSTVDVEAPNSGSWRYNGIFNESTLVASFVLSGTLCMGG